MTEETKGDIRYTYGDAFNMEEHEVPAWVFKNITKIIASDKSDEDKAARMRAFQDYATTKYPGLKFPEARKEVSK